MVTKKPSAKQLAARAKFTAMVRAKAAKNKHKKHVPIKSIGSVKKPKLFKPTKAQTKAAAKRLVKQSVQKVSNTINHDAMETLNYLVKQLSRAEAQYILLKNEIKAGRQTKSNPFYKKWPEYIKNCKKQITIAKKSIK